MSTEKGVNSKALSLYNESINKVKLSEINDLFSKIVNDTEVNIKTWEINDCNQFLSEIDPINNCQNDKEVEDEDPLITKKYIPNILISLITVLQEVQSNDIDNQIYNVVARYLYNKTEGDVKSIVNYIIPCNKKCINEKTTAIITILISSIKALLNENEKGIKELLQYVLEHVNQFEISEENKTSNSEYLNFMLSLFSELFNDMELKKVIKHLWEVTNGNTDQIAEYISYLLYEHQTNQKEDEGAESKHFGLATRIVIEEYIEPLQQKQRRQLRRNRTKPSEGNNNSQTEEEAANADLNEIYSFIKQVLQYTCLDDDQNGYPKELALFFSSFEDFWEPDRILKFMVKEINASNIEENYKEYYGPFLMDLADLMNWTNKQCESALLIITEGWKRKTRISLAKMMGLSLNDIKHLYNDCKDLTYNDADYLSDDENNENNDNNQSESKERKGRDLSKTKKPVVLSIRGSDYRRSDYRRSINKPVMNRSNLGKVCRFYGTPGGCSKGKRCPFRHIQTNRSSYISRRLNRSKAYGGRFNNGGSSRYHPGSGINNSLKHRASFQNANSYRNSSSRNSGMMNTRVTFVPSNNKIGDRDYHDKMDQSYGKKDIGINHKLRKQASFINPTKRHQPPKEFKPIEAIDPAMPRNHSNTICNFYNSPGGCDKGKNCKFLHINANAHNSGNDNRYGRSGFNSHDNNSSRKPYTGGYKSYNNNGSNYNNNYNNGPDGGMNKGHLINKKSSRSVLRNPDSKLKQDFNSYKKGGKGVNNTPDNNNTPGSITIVNSSQQNSDAPSNGTPAASSKDESNLNKNVNSTVNNKTYSQTPCVFFSKEGTCKYGDSCKFLHIKK